MLLHYLDRVGEGGFVAQNGKNKEDKFLNHVGLRFSSVLHCMGEKSRSSVSIQS